MSHVIFLTSDYEYFSTQTRLFFQNGYTVLFSVSWKEVNRKVEDWIVVMVHVMNIPLLDDSNSDQRKPAFTLAQQFSTRGNLLP